MKLSFSAFSLLIAMPSLADMGRVGAPLWTDKEPAAALLNRIYLDTAPLVAGGVGGGYEHVLLPQLTLGTYLSYFKIGESTAAANSNFSGSTQVMQYGLKSRWFFLDDARVSGPFLMGSVGAVYVNAHTQLNGTTYSTVPTNAQIQATSFGWLGGAGYQFLFGHVFDQSSKWQLNLGAQYGTGYAVQVSSVYNALSGTSIQETPQNSLFFEASIGFAF
jgi:hypothetical protein